MVQTVEIVGGHAVRLQDPLEGAREAASELVADELRRRSRRLLLVLPVSFPVLKGVAGGFVGSGDHGWDLR